MAEAQTRQRRGQALVEFVLILPLFLLIVIGLFDLGRAVYVSNTIANAARVANRVAVVDQHPSVVRAAAREEAATVALTDSDIDLTIACQQIGCMATVDISIDYVPAFPLVTGVAGPITLEASSEMPIEHVFPAP